VQDPGALGQGARDLDRIANHLRCRGGAARNTGGSIGVSLVASVFTYRQQFHQNRLIEQMIPSSTQYQDTLQQITNFFTDHGSSLSQAHDQAIEWICSHGPRSRYIDAFWVLMLISLAAVPLALMLRKVKLGGAVQIGH
jgi:MFS transporter, DHA2 family, multidrug resistance protein